jgi:hypothetical protein
MAQVILWTPQGSGLGRDSWQGLQSWPVEPVQRPKICSEQSLFKQSLTGNLALLTHSDSTLLRKKKQEPEPAPGRVSRQELALSRAERLSAVRCLCPDLPTPKP